MFEILVASLELSKVALVHMPTTFPFVLGLSDLQLASELYLSRVVMPFTSYFLTHDESPTNGQSGGMSDRHRCSCGSDL